MPRKTVTNQIDVVGKMDKTPDDGLKPYRESLFQNQFFVKPPNWDSAGDSIELLYLRNLRENENMQLLQNELVAVCHKQDKVNEARIRKLTNAQIKLRKSFTDVNSFMKDCSDKRYLAHRKISEEMAKHKVLNVRLNQKLSSVEMLESFREVLKRTIESYAPYKDVLNSVIVEEGAFNSVKECMDRCDALMIAQIEIKALEQVKLEEIEDMRKELVKVTNEAAMKILGMKNALSELERSYIAARTECLKWENILNSAKDAVGENDLNKDRVLDGVHMIYRLLCRRRGKEPKYQRQDVELQMDYIKNEFELLTEVYKECDRIRKAKLPRVKKVYPC